MERKEAPESDIVHTDRNTQLRQGIFYVVLLRGPCIWLN